MRHYTPTPVDPSVVAQQLAVVGVSGAAGFVWWTQTVPAKRLEVSRSKKSGEIAELLDEVRWAPDSRSPRRVDYFSLDVEGAESEVIRSMGTATSFGVLTVEVSAGARRVGIMRDMLARDFAYVGQISGRPSPTNYVVSDVFYNRSHFVRFWPHSRAAFV